MNSDSADEAFELTHLDARELVARMDRGMELIEQILNEGEATQSATLLGSTLTTGDTFTNSLGMVMVWCPPGTFVMGSPPEEEQRYCNADSQIPSHSGWEKQHLVTLTKPFLIAKTPVTQGVWKQIMGTTVEEQKAKGRDLGEVAGIRDDHPVYFVNWHEALAACDILSLRERAAGRLPEGYLYTLPTEAQWEYAVRAGVAGPYNVEGADPEELGWYDECRHPVGQKQPNAWGLWDCHGNVREWCSDQFARTLGSEAVTDPFWPAPDENFEPVLRGSDSMSDWLPSETCRSASRCWNYPDERLGATGFRPVLADQEQRGKLNESLAGHSPRARTVAQTQARQPSEPRFVAVRAGIFFMGSSETESERSSDEVRHEVTLSLDFEIAETPVTQAQWQRVMGNNPSYFKESGPDAPVERVSFDDAVNWCRKMSEADPEWEYRIPTEAEWEYACRAGTNGPYNIDDASLSDLGWFKENADGTTHPVKLKCPNAWGLFDCHGNVAEWCADRFGELNSEPAIDPQGHPSLLNPWGEGDERVVRGGGWNQTDCRSASRAKPMWEGQYPWGDFVGFRPVRQKKGAAKPPKRALTEEEQSKARFNMALAQRYRRMREKLGLPPTEGMWGDDSGGEAGP